MSAPFPPTRFLRYALIGDAVASGVTGLQMAVGARLLTGLLGLPESLLRDAGMLLLPYAAGVAYVGMRPAVSKVAVAVIIAINAIWTAGSLLILAATPISPTVLGYAFVIFQAAVVLGFAVAQWMALCAANRPAAMA